MEDRSGAAIDESLTVTCNHEFSLKRLKEKGVTVTLHHLYKSISDGDEKALKDVLKRKNFEEIVLEMDLEIEKHFLLLHGYKAKGEAIVWTELVRQSTGESSGIGVESFFFIENTDLMDSHIETLANLFIALYESAPDFTCEECIKWKGGYDA